MVDLDKLEKQLKTRPDVLEWEKTAPILTPKEAVLGMFRWCFGILLGEPLNTDERRSKLLKEGLWVPPEGEYPKDETPILIRDARYSGELKLLKDSWEKE